MIPTHTDEEINEAVRVLLDTEYHLTGEENLILAQSENPPVYIVPVILTDECTEDPEKVGCVEYQVSDGPPNSRSTSLDVYTYREALELFQKICKDGWI